MPIKEDPKRQAQGVSRRKFGHQIGGAAAALLISSFIRDSALPVVSEEKKAKEEKPPEAPRPVASISPELMALVGPQGVEIIKTTFESYLQAYGCPHPSIEIGVDDFSKDMLKN